MAREVLEGETSPMRAPQKPPRLFNEDDLQALESECEVVAMATEQLADVNINMPGNEAEKVPAKVGTSQSVSQSMSQCYK